MKYVIIKFYGNEIDGDYHDIHYAEYEKDMVEIHKYAERNNSRLFSLVLQTMVSMDLQ